MGVWDLTKNTFGPNIDALGKRGKEGSSFENRIGLGASFYNHIAGLVNFAKAGLQTGGNPALMFSQSMINDIKDESWVNTIRIPDRWLVGDAIFDLTPFAGRAGVIAPETENIALIDSNIIGNLRKNSSLGSALSEEQTPVISDVSGPVIRAAASRRSKFHIPGNLESMTVLEKKPNIHSIINFRSMLTPKARGNFGDGIIGAQAIELEIPLYSADKALVEAVNTAGGTATRISL